MCICIYMYLECCVFLFLELTIGVCMCICTCIHCCFFCLSRIDYKDESMGMVVKSKVHVCVYEMFDALSPLCIVILERFYVRRNHCKYCV